MRYRFAYRPYRRTFPSPLRTAHGAWVEREGAFVRLESESGSVGFGEIAPIAWFGTETLPEALEACAEIGSDPDDVRLDAVPARLGCLRFALASARADVATPLPKANATSGSRDRLPVAALLPAGRAVLEALPRRLEEGFLALKWKVGVGRAEDELSLLDDVLGRLPSYCKLRLDANGAWDRRTAEKWLERCAERPVEFVEQPVAPEHEAVLLGLATDYPVTLALDESVAGLESARAWQGRGWRGVLVMKPALAGPMADLVAWAAQTKPDLVLSSAIETAVGRAAILRVAFAHNLTRRALGFGLGSLFGDRGWDGPAMGPLLDATWADEVKPEELWNAAR